MADVSLNKRGAVMAFSKTFERELNNLFRQRTDWLRRKLGARGVGKPPEFGRKKVNTGIKKLQGIASDALAHKLAKSEFNEHIASRRNYRVKGRGYGDKKEEGSIRGQSPFMDFRGRPRCAWPTCVFKVRSMVARKRSSPSGVPVLQAARTSLSCSDAGCCLKSAR